MVLTKNADIEEEVIRIDDIFDTFEEKKNKTTTLTDSDTDYPTSKAVKTALGNMNFSSLTVTDTGDTQRLFIGKDTGGNPVISFDEKVGGVFMNKALLSKAAGLLLSLALVACGGIYTTTEVENYTPQTSTTISNSNINSITYGNGKFVAVGGYSTGDYDRII
jgi:hypothetical protein